MDRQAKQTFYAEGTIGLGGFLNRVRSILDNTQYSVNQTEGWFCGAKAPHTPMRMKLPLISHWGAALGGVHPAARSACKRAKHAHGGVPAHSGGVYGFFRLRRKNHTPHSKGEREGTWFPHTPAGYPR
jgi:hypothetical protein